MKCARLLVVSINKNNLLYETLIQCNKISLMYHLNVVYQLHCVVKKFEIHLESIDLVFFSTNEQMKTNDLDLLEANGLEKGAHESNNSLSYITGRSICFVINMASIS